MKEKKYQKLLAPSHESKETVTTEVRRELMDPRTHHGNRREFRGDKGLSLCCHACGRKGRAELGAEDGKLWGHMFYVCPFSLLHYFIRCQEMEKLSLLNGW